MWIVLFALLIGPRTLWGQAEYRVYSDHPRLFLDANRLRRLQHDVERRTSRWERLAAQLAGDAPLAEAPIARALAWQAAGDSEQGRRAVEWALERARSGDWSRPGELRWAALVFDWCKELLSEEEARLLSESISAAAEEASLLSGLQVEWARDGLLASIALAGEWDGSEQAIGRFLEGQWRGDILPALKRGEMTDDGAQLIAVLEICHAFQKNLNTDLWLDAPAVFTGLPMARIFGYYPLSFESEEGRLRRSATAPADQADRARQAALGRIAEMMLLAYNNSAQPFQYLQGWLRNDRYTLKGPLGAFYEFLWLNPYLPGLSPASAPPVAYDPVRGRIFARKGWQQGDLWVGYFNSRLEIFADGRSIIVSAKDNQAPLLFPGRAIVAPKVPSRIELRIPRGDPLYSELIFLVGLSREWSYEIKLNRKKYQSYDPAPGGVIVIRNDPERGRPKIDFNKKVRIRIRLGEKKTPGLKRPSLLKPRGGAGD